MGKREAGELIQSSVTMRRAWLGVVVLSVVGGAADAQHPQAETVRGRVVDDSSRAVVGAAVVVTRGPDRLVKHMPTDSSGRYRVTFDTGTGDYLVAVSAEGFRAARRRVQREGNLGDLVADFTLSSNVAELEEVRITARAPVRATNAASSIDLETGAAETWSGGVSGQIAPTLAGDLNAVAATMSHITQTQAGPSVLGTGPESNLNTLNGMGLASPAVPRAARTEVRVTSATFDPTRGGFSGANIDVRLGPGNRHYQQRNGFVTLDPRAFQVADAAASALGAKSGGFRASFGADGELIRQALTYNIALETAYNSSEPATLFSADVGALARAGVSPDSVARLAANAAALGLRLSGGGIPSNQQRDMVSWLGRLDDTRDSLRTRALTTVIGFNREGALGFGPLVAASAGGERNVRTFGAHITLGDYVGPRRLILIENRLAVGQVATTARPYRALPAAHVTVRSTDFTSASDVVAVVLGGGQSFVTDDRIWTVEAASEGIWHAVGRKHRFKALLWARADGLVQRGGANALGTFGFSSIEDLIAGNASSFSRTLSQATRSGRVWNGAAALAHAYNHSRFFDVLYGLRVETNGFLDAPQKNPLLERELAVRTGAAPGRVHVSPRIGFSYRYNKERRNTPWTMFTRVGQFHRYSTGVIRGGVGEFRDVLRPNVLADARGATGVLGGTSYLNCVGAATPYPDWRLFESNSEAIPSHCLDEYGPLGERAPGATLIHPTFDVPRSWRASLEWSTNVQKWLFKVSGLASYDLSQPGVVDANFSATPRFTLASEGGRSVFVTPSAIDANSGSMSATESRTSDQFGRVTTRVSDLRGYGGQLNLALSPDVLKFRSRYSLYLSGNYTIQWMRRQYRGFDGAAAGDPRTLEWAPNDRDARHIFVLSAGIATPKLGSVTLFGRAQSGLPFTPIVQGDVNGDGRTLDRAFVPDPRAELDPSVAVGIRSLVQSGSAVARNCLAAHLGAMPGRNTCRGAVSHSLNIQWRPPMPRFARRMVASAYLQNVLARRQFIDPVLLVPKGFDMGTRRFLYDVNSRFGSNQTGRAVQRAPFRLVIDVAMNLSTDFNVQQLRRAVEPVRVGNDWRRRTADSIASFYLSRTSSIHKMLLAERDSLFLSATQVEMLRLADSVYSERVRAIFSPLGELLAHGHGSAGKAELDSVMVTQKAYWQTFWEQPEIAAEIVTPSQRALVQMLTSLLQTPPEARKTGRAMFGHPVKIVDPK